MWQRVKGPSFPRSRGGLIGLAVFGLPFLGVGVYGAYQFFESLWLRHVAGGWTPVEANISELNFVEKNGEDGATYQFTCTYDYAVGGQVYRGERVGLDSGPDSVGSWHRDTYVRLKAAQDVGGAVTCYVNPREPHEAVLILDMRPMMLFFWAGLGVGLGTPGLLMTGGSLWRLWRGKTGALYSAVAVAGVLRIRAVNRERLLGIWGATISWNALMVAGVSLLGSSPDVVFLLLQALGVWMVFDAAYETLAYAGFGRSELELHRLPKVGETLEGEVVLRGAAERWSQVHMVLQCVFADRHGDGGGRERVVWERRESGQVGAGLDGEMRARVRFETPADQPPSSTAERDGIEWRLLVTGGTRKSLDFVVPLVGSTNEERARASGGEDSRCGPRNETAYRPVHAERLRDESPRASLTTGW